MVRQLLICKKDAETVYSNLLQINDEEYEDFEEEADLNDLKPADLEEKNYCLDDDQKEEGFDLLSGSEDPEEFNEREWDGKISKVFIIKKSDILKTMEWSLVNQFEELEFWSLYNYFQYPWLGHCDMAQEVEEGITIYKTKYPGKANVPLRLLEQKPTIYKLTKLKDLSDELIHATKTYDELDKDFMNECNDDFELYQYQCQVLEANGFVNPEQYSKYFFKKTNISNEEIFWKRMFDKIEETTKILTKKATKTKVNRTYVLPGYTGVLKDPEIACELNTLFNNKAIDLIRGNHCLTKSTYKQFLMLIKSLYNKVDPDQKALLTIILAIMKDCMITTESDSWFVDNLNELIIPIVEKLDEKTDENVYIPPEPTKIDIIYKIKNVFE